MGYIMHDCSALHQVPWPRSIQSIKHAAQSTINERTDVPAPHAKSAEKGSALLAATVVAARAAATM